MARDRSASFIPQPLPDAQCLDQRFASRSFIPQAKGAGAELMHGPALGGSISQRSGRLEYPPQHLDPGAPALAQGQRPLHSPAQPHDIGPTFRLDAPPQHTDDGLGLNQQAFRISLTLRPSGEVGQRPIQPWCQVPLVTKERRQITRQAVAGTMRLHDAPPFKRLQQRSDIGEIDHLAQALGADGGIAQRGQHHQHLLLLLRKRVEHLARGGCSYLPGRLRERKPLLACYSRGLNKMERVTFQRFVNRPRIRLLLRSQRAAQLPLDQGQGIVERQALQPYGAAFPPELSLR